MGKEIKVMKKEKFVQMKVSFDLGKNGCHKPSGLGGWSICCDEVVKRNSSSLRFFKFDNFKYKIKYI